MRQSRSMENLQMLPEDAQQAACLLRLTLNDTEELPNEFETYICKYSQFPYHKSVSSPAKKSKDKSILPRPRGGSAPCTVTFAENRSLEVSVTSASSCSRLSESDSAPCETQGFFRRLLPSFLRKSQEIVKPAESPKPVEPPKSPLPAPEVPSKKSSFIENSFAKENEHGHIVHEFTRISTLTNMDRLALMSLR